MNYRNQKRIKIEELKSPLLHTKKEKGDETEQFLVALNWKELNNIMTDLTEPGFKLWLYILKWRGKGYYDFSPADLNVNFGWSENSCRKYRDELIKKGYLNEISQNQYSFEAYPEKVESRAAIKREERRK